VAELFVTTGRLTWADVADRMSIAPARIVGILGHGQPLEVGAPANICLVDPQRTWRTQGRDLASIAENTPYEGMEFSTRVVATLLRGKVTYDLDSRFA
jgi:dihydroorotase